MDPWGGDLDAGAGPGKGAQEKKGGYSQRLPTRAVQPEGNAGPRGGDQGRAPLPPWASLTPGEQVRALPGGEPCGW